MLQAARRRLGAGGRPRRRGRRPPRRARGAADRGRRARRRRHDARAAPRARSGRACCGGRADAEAAAGGSLMCDMLPHDHEEYRQQMGHVWLGFGDDQLAASARGRGLRATSASSRCLRIRRPKARRFSWPRQRMSSVQSAVWFAVSPLAVVRSTQSQRSSQPLVFLSTSQPRPSGRARNKENDDAVSSSQRNARVRSSERRPAASPFKVKDLVPGRVRPQGDPPRRAGDARPDGPARRATTGQQPLAGAEDHGQPAHDDPDRRADRDACRAWARTCAGCRATSSPRRTTPPPRSWSAGRRRAAPSRTRRAPRSSPGRARRSRSTGGAPSEALLWPDGTGPDQIVDDGGDATLLIHKGIEFEKAGKVPAFDAGQRPGGVGRHPRPAARSELKENPKRWTKVAASMQGVTEETTTGVHRLYEMQKAGTLLFPAINVNDSRHQEQVRQHLRLPPLADRRPEPRHRRDDRRQGRGRLRLRRRRQGLRQALRGQGCRVIVTEIDPICALQAAMEGYQVRPLEDVVEQRRHLRHRRPATSNIITADHMAKMKDKAIVGNIGHFDNEIDMAGLKKVAGIKQINIKPQYDELALPGRPQRADPRRRPPAEPRLRHRPPELRDVGVVHQPDDRPDRAAPATTTSTRRRSTSCRSTSTRRSPACTWTSSA